MRRRFQSRKPKFLVAFVAALCLAGGAFAYWTASGSGSGTSSVGNASALTITAGPATLTPLFPGGSANVAVKISNPNHFLVHISTLALDTSQGESNSGFDASPSGCDLATPALTFTSQTNGTAGWDVPARVDPNDGVLNLDLTGAIHMSTTASNDCQGATFTVYLNPNS